MTLRRDLVLAIHPARAEQILDGQKTYELRSRFPSVQTGTRVYLYATAPVSAVIGGFVVGEIVEDTRAEVWSKVGSGLCLTETEFEEYSHGHPRIKAIRVSKPFRLSRPVLRNELQSDSLRFSPPQSAAFLQDEGVRLHFEHLM